jgi:pyridoxamine 5'-phosphate oxidase family protein
MAVFTEQERSYLAEQRFGRLATVDAEGRPHVVPVGFRLDPDAEVIAIGGFNLAVTKKFRDAAKDPHVAFVVDDIASFNPWRARGVEVRGRAETLTEGGERLMPGFGPAWIRVVPEKVVSWGLEDGPPTGRSVD